LKTGEGEGGNKFVERYEEKGGMREVSYFGLKISLKAWHRPPHP
jgi:hypothetical protein